MIDLTERWNHDIDNLEKKGILSPEAGTLLLRVLTAYQYNVIPTSASPREIVEAQQYLKDGVSIYWGEEGRREYDVMVTDPHDPLDGRRFIVLIARFSGRKFKYLSDI